jgi:hypothetical protein
MTESGRMLWLPCCGWQVLVVMTHLAEEGCFAALPSQFAYTRSRNCISRTSPPWLSCMLRGCLPLSRSYPKLTSGYDGIYILHLP